VVVAVTAAVLVLDALTKAWALGALKDDPIGLVGPVRLALTYNKAGAFGLGGAVVPFLALAAVILVIVMVTTGSATAQAPAAVALGMILGGAFGNLADRVFRDPGLLRGAVVDFVDVGFWPVFNLADAAITCGCVVLLWAGWAKR